MEDLKAIKKCLINQVQMECSDLKKVNTKELGEVIDMIKDLEEAMYYCAIIKAMEKGQDNSWLLEDKKDMSRYIYEEKDKMLSPKLQQMAEK